MPDSADFSFADIDEMEPWIISSRRCPVCEKKANYFTHTNDKKKYECIQCFHNRVVKYLSGIDISHWTWISFLSALSSLLYDSMSKRLTALIHFKKFKQYPELPELLIENLGFISNHPLDSLVRQKAFDALSEFNDSRKILNELLKIKKFNSWQQKINIMAAAYEINPSDVRVAELVRKMGYDPSPNVRKSVVMLIKNNKQIWAKTLFADLQTDANPLVREACMAEIQNQIQNSQQNIRSLKNKNQFQNRLKNKKTAHKTPFHTALEKLIARDKHIQSNYKKIYKLYLSHLPELMDKQKYNEEQLKFFKQNTKTSCVKLIAAAITDRSLFAAFLEKLPKFIVSLIYLCIYEMHEIDKNLIKEKLRLYLMDGDSYHDSDVRFDNKDPAFFLFRTKMKYLYSYDYSNVIFINRDLRKYIANCLPRPDFISIKPVKNIKGLVEHIYEDKHDILQKLPLILNSISQGHLQFNKNGNKILVKSLKKIAKTCSIREYYNDKNKYLNFLKTTLIGKFLNCIQPWEMKELKNTADFMKKRLNLYFSHKDFNDYNCRSAYDHIKQQYPYYNSLADEKRLRGSLKKIFQMIPSGKKWIFVDKLAQASFYSEINLNPFPSQYEYNDLYILLQHHPDFSYKERVSVKNLFYFDVILLPLIKQMMFLFGALGIVDIGYSYPENMIYKQYNKPWLTVYDGLKYVRMTDLGDYIFGRKKQFKTNITLKSSKIEMDENRTILSIYGEDPIKHMMLESMGQKINKSSYMVTCQSFLKNCNNTEDVKNKIALFRKNIAKKPPAIWENFFRDVLARINPIQEVHGTMVFKINPDRELLLLLTTDNILKKYIIRAENYHLIVKISDFSKIKKRLAALGFFIERP